MSKKKQAKTGRKFVAISDLHAHPWSAFAHGDGLENDRLQRTLGVLRASLQRARELDCPWVFGGDIVHTAGYALNVVLASLTDVFAEFPEVPKLAVWGNHDARGVGGKIVLDQTIWSALLRAVSNLTVLDPTLSQPIVERGGLTFSGVGAQPRVDLIKLPLPSDVGVYHATLAGSVGPNGYVFERGVDPGELAARHKFMIVGDLHHPQHPALDILVPGSPEHHNFGDFGAHGWWIVSMPSGTTEFVASGSPEFRTVGAARDVKNDDNFYRVLNRVVGETLPENATVVAPEPMVVQSRDVLRGLTGDQILQAWLVEEPADDAFRAGATPTQVYSLGQQLLSQDDVGQLQDVRLKLVELTNFCSYEDDVFVIRDGTWLVLGKGRDYPSNGAGKSTLFESIFWLLFGRTTKGLTGDEVIRWGAPACAVRGVFENVHGGILEVRRTRGESSRLEVFEGEDSIPWEATSVNEMTDKLSKHLGITPELFQALGYFSQERMLLFASATDGERKEMLADLIGLSSYQAASAAAQKAIDELTTRIAGNEGMQRGAEEGLIAQRVTMEQMRERFQQWLEDHERRRLEAVAALDSFDGSAQRMFEQLMQEAIAQLSQTNEANTTTMRQRVAQAEIELSKPQPATRSPEQLQAARRTAELTRADMVRAIAQVEGLERELMAVQKRVAAAERDLDTGECPSCGQAIGIEHRQRCLAPLLREQQQLESSLGMLRLTQEAAISTAADHKIELDACEVGVKAAEHIARWSDQLQESKDGLDQLVEEAARIHNVAKDHVTKVLDDKRAELKRAIGQIDREHNPHRLSEESATAQVKEAEAKLAKRKREHADMVQQVVMHEYWRRGFSKQGIQSLLMDEVAGAFNAVRGAIFPALTQGVYDVQFSTLSRTKAGEARERTEFKVYEHSILVPYSALSGGQRRRIDVGVMLALVKAISTWMHVPGAFGLLVLDEVFGFLDASGAEGLMEALRDVQAVVPAIYAISHDPQLQALFSGTVMVEQDELGVSRIANGGDRNGDVDPVAEMEEVNQ